MSKKIKIRSRNTYLLIISLVFMLSPLLIRPHAQFQGTDDQAIKVISQVAPNYHAWISPLWTPASSEIESLLFSLQSALGAGLLGYFIGFKKGLRKAEKQTNASDR